jgi:hypothetical protein
MEYGDSDLPILSRACNDDSCSTLSLNELDKVPVPINDTLFNTDTRAKTNRRQNDLIGPDDEERRKGRDRRLLSYY